MQAGERDDRDRLARAAHAFFQTSEHAQELGRLLPTRGEGLVDAVLAEIDETVLRRRLRFRTDSGSELCVVVCERRVVSLPSGDVPCVDVIRKPILSDKDAGAVLQAFSHFCAAANQIYVVSLLPDAGSGAEVGGISVQTLIALDRSKGAHVSKPVERAIELCKQWGTAVVAVYEDRIVQWGKDDDCVRLSEWMRMKDVHDADDPCVSLWKFDTHDRSCVLYVRLQDSAIGLTCPGQHMLRCFDVWRQLVQDRDNRP